MLIYRRTPKGQQEMLARKSAIPPVFSSLLILINGKRSVTEIHRLAALVKAPRDALDNLAEMGLVEPVTQFLDDGARHAPAPPPPSPGLAARTLAVLNTPIRVRPMPSEPPTQARIDEEARVKLAQLITQFARGHIDATNPQRANVLARIDQAQSLDAMLMLASWMSAHLENAVGLWEARTFQDETQAIRLDHEVRSSALNFALRARYIQTQQRRAA
ncbi:MAG: hypothetical protein KGL39_21575 [Patescibacteria group bacterium]|nr:hypothetical protein [Patescibacteria group bacterium]